MLGYATEVIKTPKHTGSKRQVYETGSRSRSPRSRPSVPRLANRIDSINDLLLVVNEG